MEEITLPLQAVQKVIGLELTDSTNNVAKELAQDGQEANTLVLACRQTGAAASLTALSAPKKAASIFHLFYAPRYTRGATAVSALKWPKPSAARWKICLK